MNKEQINLTDEFGKSLTQVGLRIATIRMNMNFIHLELGKIITYTNQLKKEIKNEKIIKTKKKRVSKKITS